MFSGIPYSTIFSALKYVPQIPYFAYRCSSGALVVDQWDPPDKSYDLHDRIVRFQPLFLKSILNISVEYFRSPRILFKNCT